MTQQKSRTTARSRRFGYALAALVNFILYLLVTGPPGWHAVPFLTSATHEVIDLVMTALLAGVVTNLVTFFGDRVWAKALGEILTSSITLILLMRLWTVFPFDFTGANLDWELVTRVILAFAMAGCAISIIVQTAVLIRISIAWMPLEH